MRRNHLRSMMMTQNWRGIEQARQNFEAESQGTNELVRQENEPLIQAVNEQIRLLQLKERTL